MNRSRGGVDGAGLRLGGGRWPRRAHGQETERSQDDSERYPAGHGELPAIEEPSVEPVPQQIDQHLCGPVVGLPEGYADAGVQQDVLPRGEADLDLRDGVPVGGPAFAEGPRREDLDHGGPGAAETMLGEGGSERRTPKDFPPEFSARRELETRLEVQKAVSREDLAEGDERFQDGDAVPETPIPVSGGDDDFAGGAEDRAALQAVEQHPLVGEGHVPDPAVPVSRRLSEAERQEHLDLVPGTEALFVEELARDLARLAAVPAEGQYVLVFRKRLPRWRAAAAGSVRPGGQWDPRKTPRM